MGKKQVEVETFNCTYCGYEAVQLTRLAGQSKEVRYICGDCMIKSFDKGMSYEAPKEAKPEATPEQPVGEPAVPEPSKEGQGIDPGTTPASA